MIKTADVIRLTRHMDKMANQLQRSPEAHGLSREQARRMAYDLDVASDRLERMVGVGRDAEKGHEDEEEKDADVVDHDRDEDYMPSYDEAGPVDNQMDVDEPYMNHFRDDTFDQLIDHRELTPGNSTPGGEDSSDEVDASWWMSGGSADTDWRNW